MPKNFKSVANVVKLSSKKHFNNFLDNNNQERVGLAKIEKFCAKNFISCANDWDFYSAGNISKTRTKVSLTLKGVLFLMLLRYITCALFDNNLAIRSTLSDGTYLLGNQRLICIYGSMGSFTALLFGLIFNYYELKGRLFVVQITKHCVGGAENGW